MHEFTSQGFVGFLFKQTAEQHDLFFCVLLYFWMVLFRFFRGLFLFFATTKNLNTMHEI